MNFHFCVVRRTSPHFTEKLQLLMDSEWDQWDHLAAGSGSWATCLTTALYELCKHPFPLFFYSNVTIYM